MPGTKATAIHFQNQYSCEPFFSPQTSVYRIHVTRTDRVRPACWGRCAVVKWVLSLWFSGQPQRPAFVRICAFQIQSQETFSSRSQKKSSVDLKDSGDWIKGKGGERFKGKGVQNRWERLKEAQGVSGFKSVLMFCDLVLSAEEPCLYYRRRGIFVCEVMGYQRSDILACVDSAGLFPGEFNCRTISQGLTLGELTCQLSLVFKNCTLYKSKFSRTSYLTM